MIKKRNMFHYVLDERVFQGTSQSIPEIVSKTSVFILCVFLPDDLPFREDCVFPWKRRMFTPLSPE